ncbi:hypothetical protein [Hahella ganghwensis]|uniref:hypothetical protein n=1 Tax=Hahella ganghwensis TaxID=286420 RepID=UPI0003600AA3|nr:hypothetical protein [Hahella ganghwensis]
MSLQQIKLQAMSQSKRLYVTTMMQVVGRALQSISEQDEEIRKITSVFPVGFVFSMQVLPEGPGFALRKNADNSLAFLSELPEEKPDLTIYIKHLEHAFRILSFQESTAKAFANDRMLVDGDISYAIRMTRALNRLEAFILPKLVAQLAVKEYPDIPLPEKVIHGARIYLRVATNLISQQVKFA